MTYRNEGAALAAALLLAAAACGDADPTLPEQGAVGSYQLVSVDGRPLPAAVVDAVIEAEEPFHLRVVAREGAFLLTPDGRYEQRVEHEVFIDGRPAPAQSWVDRGTWALVGGSLEFESELIQNVRFTATHAGARLESVRDHLGEGFGALYRYERN